MDDRDFQVCKEKMYLKIVEIVQEGQNEELMLNDLVRIRRCTDEFIGSYLATQGKLPNYKWDVDISQCVVSLESYGYKIPRLERWIREDTENLEAFAKEMKRERMKQPGIRFLGEGK
jgi:hypothetical protein